MNDSEKLRVYETGKAVGKQLATTELVELEDAAMRLLNALGEEEAWESHCSDVEAGREPICKFPDDFNEDSIGDEIREATNQLLSLVLDSRFRRNHPAIAATFDRPDPDSEMTKLGRRRYNCPGCGWVSWVKTDEPDHCHSSPPSAYPNCIHLGKKEVTQ